MKQKIIPSYLIRLLLKMGIFILIFTLCRVLFLLFNLKAFPVVYFTDFLAGIWFDTVTTAIVFLPIAGIEIFPNKWRDRKIFRILFALTFHISLFLCISINLIDIEYFKFTSARSTVSLFTMLGYGDDLGNQLPSFFSDYWHLLIFLAGLQWLAYFLYKRVNRIPDDSATVAWWKQILIVPIMGAVLVLVGRGGIGLRPIAPAKAASYTIDQNMPLILNSAFTVIKTWGSATLEEKNYFPADELTERFNPVHTPEYTVAPIPGSNVVLIILESFSVEYIASINGTQDVYTPFLDSLIDESLVFTNCYANGKKSIDAMPSLISSIPKLMEVEYLTSAYASNKIESLPKQLHEMGYSSAFYHGATNGTMNFDVFCDIAGFDFYFGRTEYNNEAHFDGTWGIYDEEFLAWTADKMSEMSQPFFSTVFTISSHPPYKLPERYVNKFNQGPEDVHNAVRYTDFALSQFFKKMQTMPWYQNTLFVITADHTPASGTDIYFKDMGNMHIPLIFFHPADSNFQSQRSDKVVSQSDVMPSLLELTGYPNDYFAFGQSVFSPKPGYSASFIGNKFIFFADHPNGRYMLTWQDEKITGIYRLTDLLQSENLMTDQKLGDDLVNQLKAIIQTYNHALITNQMTAR